MRGQRGGVQGGEGLRRGGGGGHHRLASAVNVAAPDAAGVHKNPSTVTCEAVPEDGVTVGTARFWALNGTQNAVVEGA